MSVTSPTRMCCHLNTGGFFFTKARKTVVLPVPAAPVSATILCCEIVSNALAWLSSSVIASRSCTCRMPVLSSLPSAAVFNATLSARAVALATSATPYCVTGEVLSCLACACACLARALASSSEIEGIINYSYMLMLVEGKDCLAFPIDRQCIAGYCKGQIIGGRFPRRLWHYVCICSD